ncbi:MAG: hypothetical protein RL199_2112 [Pseudomonadota bacterium]|jgi:DNA-binding NtrC family response regulator
MPFDRLDDLRLVRHARQRARRWWSVEIAFADKDGFVVDHGRGVVVPPHNPVCQAALRSTEGFARCNRSIEKAVVSLGGTEPRACGPCHLGLDIVAAPVPAHGAVFACGLLVDGAADRLDGITTRARALGLGRTLPDLPEAAARIPRVEGRDVGRLLDTLGEVALELEENAGPALPTTSEPLFNGRLVAGAPSMARAVTRLQKVAATSVPVLVEGEPGTGKELFARLVHDLGPHRDGPFVVQGCGALAESLLESELFGHVRGAFTGAVRDKPGLLRQADGGTLVLDDVADMSPTLQVRLLRFLQEGTLQPVGADDELSVEARVVATTRTPLHQLVAEGRFREDLFHRLNVVDLHVPPLRERLEDLPALCEHLLARIARRLGAMPRRLSPELVAAFRRWSWPGNVRELENALERLAVLSPGDTLSVELWAAERRAAPAVQAGSAPSGDLASAVASLERTMIATGLVATHGNRTHLADRLGLSRTTLIKKIKEYGLEDEES